MEIFEEIKKILDENNAKYELHKVPDGIGSTVEEHIKAFNLDFSDGCATLVFIADGSPVALMRRDDTKVDSKKFRKAIGANSLRFASPQELLDFTGFQAGMVSPLLLKLPLFIDAKVLEKKSVRVGSGSNEFSLEVSVDDLKTITRAKVVEVCDIVNRDTALESGSMKKRILTGDRPTGPLHLGHFLGSIQNRVKLQDEYDLFYLIADVQALTDNHDNPEKVSSNVLQVAQDNLACGLDPNKSTIFIQSMIPEIAELTVFFMNLVTHSEVLRNPTVKTEIKDKNFGDSTPFGFVAYPVSQAADILVVKSNLVPVGKDQAPMIELSRVIARRFNSTYASGSEIFPEPQPKFGVQKNLVGTDGDSKMSKSKGNTINLIDDTETVKRKVKAMYTDPTRIRATDPGKVEGNPVFIYHDFFNENKDEVQDLKERYTKGTVGDVEVKEKLAGAIEKFLEPIREARKKYPMNLVEEIVMEGTKRAKQEAEKTMQQVRKAMRIDY